MEITSGAVKQRSAVRLASTRGLSREQWLRIRKQGIGSSDAAAAVGVNHYQSPLELWMIKTGRDDLLPAVDPEDMESPMYWGQVLEPIVAAHYTKFTGNKVRKINAVLQHPDEDKSWMLANLDYTVTGSDEVQILECKTAGEYGARLWREGVPDYVRCQVQHQLAVTGKAAADVCVLLCGQAINIHRIERDEQLITNLIELERRFWEFVVSDTPPPTDGSDSSALAVKSLFPRDNGETIDLSHDQQLSDVFDQLVSNQANISRLRKEEAKLKQGIQQVMGDASKATFQSGEVHWKRSKDTTVLNSESLLKEHPELLEQYPLNRPGTRRFLIRT